LTDLSKLPIDIMQELVLNTMPVRVFWKDTEFRYMGCNKNFAIDAGFALPKEVIGKTDSVKSRLKTAMVRLSV